MIRIELCGTACVDQGNFIYARSYLKSMVDDCTDNHDIHPSRTINTFDMVLKLSFLSDNAGLAISCMCILGRYKVIYSYPYPNLFAHQYYFELVGHYSFGQCSSSRR